MDDLAMKWETDVSIPIHCFLFNAVYFKEYGIAFDESLPNHEDWDCWMTLFALNPKIIYVDQPLANYRIRKHSVSYDISKNRQGYLMAINKQKRKNKLNKDMIRKLNKRKKQIKHLYQDAVPLIRTLKKCRRFVGKFLSQYFQREQRTHD